jgi:hypothetical protein
MIGRILVMGGAVEWFDADNIAKVVFDLNVAPTIIPRKQCAGSATVKSETN